MKTITIKDESYNYQRIDVRRDCRMEDLQAIYRVTKQIGQDGQELGFYDQDFDEYHCSNCELYDIDFGKDHPLPQ